MPPSNEENIAIQDLNKELELAVLQFGDTSLHWILRTWPSSKIISFITSTDSISLYKMAKTINDKGELPIDIALQLNLDSQIFGLLTPITILNTIRPLSKSINTDKLLNESNYASNSEIYKNLELGCRVANRVREIIKSSSTHPEINETSNENKIKLEKKINEIRQNLPKNHLLSYWKMWICTNPMDLLFNYYNTFIEKNLIAFIAEGSGNCGEMAYIGYSFIKKLNIPIVAEVCRIHHGDHAFLIIGEGNNKIVCDPWAGEVYPYNEINTRLSIFKQYNTNKNSYVNTVGNYNPYFHSIRPMPMNTKHLFIFMSILISPILLIGAGIYHGLTLISTFYTSIFEEIPVQANVYNIKSMTSS